MTLKKEKINTILFILYFWSFVVLKPIIIFFPNYSTFIISFIIFVILIVSLLVNKGNVVVNKAYILPITLLCLSLFDLVFRLNSYTTKYIIELVFYAFFSIYLVSMIRDYKYFIEYMFKISIIVFIFFGLDPLNDYYYFDNYMGYGFNLILPVFLATHFFKLQSKSKFYALLEIFILLMLIVFSNRSVIVSVITLYLIELLYRNKSLYKKIFYSLLGLLFLINLDIIVSTLLVFLSSVNIESYSLNSLRNFLLSYDTNILFSGRFEIWEQSIKLFIDSPIFGYGYGYTEASFGFYIHNIILDLVVHYGLLVSVPIVFIVITGTKKLHKSIQVNNHVLFLFFILWFPKLLFSDYFIKDIAFWGFLTIAFSQVYSKGVNSIEQQNP